MNERNLVETNNKNDQIVKKEKSDVINYDTITTIRNNNEKLENEINSENEDNQSDKKIENKKIHKLNSELSLKSINEEVQSKNLYQLRSDSNVKVLNPNINSNNSSQYLQVKKKYSSCQSISSASTCIAPPMKYINSSFQSNFKSKYLIYILIILMFTFVMNIYSYTSSTWLIVNTEYNSTISETNNNSLHNATELETKKILQHYEFGNFNYCTEEYNKKENRKCEPISTKCPKFCTTSSCINFEPNEIKPSNNKNNTQNMESNKDDSFDFCSFIYEVKYILSFNMLFHFGTIVCIFVALSLNRKYKKLNKVKKNEQKKFSTLAMINRKISKLSKSNLSIGNEEKDKKIKDRDLSENSIYCEPEPYETKTDTKTNYNSNTTLNQQNQMENALSYNNIYQSISPSHSYYSMQIMDNATYQSVKKLEQSKNKKNKKNKKIILTYYYFTIVFSLFIAFFSSWCIYIWVKIHKHTGISYLDRQNKEFENSQLDIFLGVSVIIVSICAAINIVISIGLIIWIFMIKCSNNKSWNVNENEDDFYRNSYCSTDSSMVQPNISWNQSMNNIPIEMRDQNTPITQNKFPLSRQVSKSAMSNLVIGVNDGNSVNRYSSQNIQNMYYYRT